MPTSQQQIETRSGLTYATHDGVALAGDLYLPAGTGPFPALVAAHGGGWQAGARSAFQYWGPYLAARGYALFAISYRLAEKGQKMVPQAVTDARPAGPDRRVSGRGHRGRPRQPARADRRIPIAAQASQLFRAPLHRGGRAALLAQRPDRGGSQLFRLSGDAPHALLAGAAVRLRRHLRRR